jgi:hypothetical protein
MAQSVHVTHNNNGQFCPLYHMIISELLKKWTKLSTLSHDVPILRKIPLEFFLILLIFKFKDR